MPSYDDVRDIKRGLACVYVCVPDRQDGGENDHPWGWPRRRHSGRGHVCNDDGEIETLDFDLVACA